MTPEQKRQKLNEMEARARSKRLLAESEGHVLGDKTVYVWYNGKLVDMPESVAKKYGYKY